MSDQKTISVNGNSYKQHFNDGLHHYTNRSSDHNAIKRVAGNQVYKCTKYQNRNFISDYKGRSEYKNEIKQEPVRQKL